MRILLIEPPGAGKGTQGVRPAAHLSIAHISTGDLFRKHIDQGTELDQHELSSPWDGCSSAGVSIRSWPGGHFSLYDRPAEFAAQWVSDVRASPRLPGSRPTVRQEASWG